MVQTYVTINGVDVLSTLITWQDIETYGSEIPDAFLLFSFNLLSTLDVENGQTVIIKRGPTTGQEYNVFKGKVDTVLKNKPYIEVRAKNELITLVKTDVNTSFDKNIDSEVGVASAIANTLITDFGGLSTNSGATVVSTGSSILLDKFNCRKTDVFERVKWIADTFNYQIYYNYDDDYVYFEPQGYSSNNNSLIIGTNVSNVPKWEFDNTQLVNQIRVEGAVQMVETTESGQIGVTSNYTTSSILLTKSPFSTKVFCDATNPPTTLRTGGTPEGTATFDYSVDTENNKIVWNTSQYTPGGSDYVQVRYTYASPDSILRKRNSSITAYGLSSTTKYFNDIKTIEDATNRANVYLDTYSEPFVRVQLHVPSISNNYKVGEKVTIVDGPNDITTELVINKIIKSFPHKYDVLHCGNKEYAIAEYNKLTLDKIKRLEEEQNKNDDILIQIIDLSRTFKPRRRYCKLTKKSITDSNAMIWNHPTQGTWGSFNWEEDAFGSETTEGVIQGGMTYQEALYDTDFEWVLSSDTMNTGTQTITFTNGMWNSDKIHIGPVISYITINLGTVSAGTLSIRIRDAPASVSSQVITEGVRTALTNSWNSISIELETVTGTPVLTNTLDSYGQIQDFAIDVLLEE